MNTRGHTQNAAMDSYAIIKISRMIYSDLRHTRILYNVYIYICTCACMCVCKYETTTIHIGEQTTPVVALRGVHDALFSSTDVDVVVVVVVVFSRPYVHIRIYIYIFVIHLAPAIIIIRRNPPPDSVSPGRSKRRENKFSSTLVRPRRGQHDVYVMWARQRI